MYSKVDLVLRKPHKKDGIAVHDLVEACPPLDPNSSYCNFLQCIHFSETAVAAEVNGQLLGFISAYLLPEQLNTLFIWQVAVHEQARGQGLASKMLQHILSRDICSDVNYLETTITEDNAGSWALFKSFAEKKSANLHSSVWLDKDDHFCGRHATEMLVRVGPFGNSPKEGENHEDF